MNWNRIFFLLLIIVVQAGLAVAQPGGGGDPGHGHPVPISGLEILIAAGGILGLKRLWKERKKNTDGN